MRIAQVAPLFESVPPKLYGGTERVVSYLTEELVHRGHDVTLFASGDSVTSAKLEVCSPTCLRTSGIRDHIAPHLEMIERVYDKIDYFDLIHFHVDYLHFPISSRHHQPQVTTLHGRLDLPEILPIHQRFHNMPLVSISTSQRKSLPNSNWVSVIHHGLPPNLYRQRFPKKNYLAFLGRIAPEKGVHTAIEISSKMGLPLKIAAKVDPADKNYFESCIQPLLGNPLVEFIGEIDDANKNQFLAQARALIFPIDWPEPFGLVMIEAMACGTPVIALDRGSVSEIIKNGKTGFVVQNADEACRALSDLDMIQPDECRREFKERFSVERMTDDYLKVYCALTGRPQKMSPQNQTTQPTGVWRGAG